MKTVLFIIGLFLFGTIYAQDYNCIDIRNKMLNDNLDNGVYFKENFWEIGETITIKFLNGSDFLHKKVKYYAKQWTTYANLNFDFVDNGYADIRISFYPKKGSWSLIGLASKSHSVNIKTLETTRVSDGPTMNFGWFNEQTKEDEFRRVIIHEFGHALGLLHEQSNPLGGILWNKPFVYAYYKQNLGWSSEKVDSNVFSVYNVEMTNGSYDPLSIMHYPIRREFTLNGYEVGRNTKLSLADKGLMKKIYSKQIIENNSNPFGIATLTYGGEMWQLVMSNGTDYENQRWNILDEDPESSIDKYISDGFYVTELAYGDKAWAIVASENSNYTSQAWGVTPEDPENTVEELWDLGYNVTSIEYGESEKYYGYWVIVGSKGSNDKIQRCVAIYNPKTEVSEMNQLGFKVTDIEYGESQNYKSYWLIIGTKESGIIDQIVVEANEDYEMKIAKIKSEGYSITSLEYGKNDDGDDIWIIIGSKNSAVIDQQLWSESTSFPKKKIEEIWKKTVLK